MKHVAVYCSSSSALKETNLDVARDVGTRIGTMGFSLVYGGTNVGLMGTVADTAKQHGSSIIAVIPKALEECGIAYTEADELIITADMYERNKVMCDRADAYVILPGGFGTLWEALEVITLKQLHFHTKPIVFINTLNFFDPLFLMFEKMFEENASKDAYRDLYYNSTSPLDAFEYLASYTPTELPQKWFKK